MKLQTDIDRVAGYLKNARKVSVLTGAGVSKESGIPTFRDAQTGLWANFDPEALATPQGFLADPPLVWKWYDYRRKLLLEAQPNAGHYALVQLERLVPSLAVITQNIDGLHHKAGSSDVIELHGSIMTFYCFDKRHVADDVPFDLEEPPKCLVCGSMLRPGVVWFNEALPHEALERAIELCETSDVVLVVGTSGLVQPAASLPLSTLRRGGKVIEVNPEETPLTRVAHEFLPGPSGEVLPQMVAALKRLVAS